jgi:hypothetical protein
MNDSSTSLLKRLEALKNSFGGDASSTKLHLLRQLERRRLKGAAEVLRLHELLCFWRAYPDDGAVLGQVERMLESFAERSDLRRHANTLADSGIAGTPTYYSFFWPTARWLVRHWPEKLSIDWPALENSQRILEFLHLLLPYSETPALDMLDHTVREWIDKLRGPSESDAAFLIRRFDALRASAEVRETLFESFEIPIRLSAGENTPARTHARYGPSPVAYQTRPLSRRRPDLRREIQRPPVAVRAVSKREGRKLIDLAREAMVTRSRDLEVFAQADENDVRIVDCGGGLQFACIGAVPERRLILESVYGFLTLKNGVPMGYVLASSLFRSTEVAYNIFDSYRGAEAAAVFGRVLAMVHHLFGSEIFSIDPYQLGYGNAEGLQSGAWWFYYKMGFRPVDPDVRRVMRGELKKMKKNPRHRSDAATLERLASEHVFYRLDRSRRISLGSLPLGTIGMRISRQLADRHGGNRERAIRECSREAADLLGLRSFSRFSPGERLAWRRWSPLIVCLKGVNRWSAANKRALVKVVRAKGGRRESEFVKLFDRHRLLTKAVHALARE